MNTKLYDKAFELQAKIKNVNLKAATIDEGNYAITINDATDEQSFVTCFMNDDCTRILAIQPALLANPDFVDKVIKGLDK